MTVTLGALLVGGDGRGLGAAVAALLGGATAAALGRTSVGGATLATVKKRATVRAALKIFKR